MKRYKEEKIGRKTRREGRKRGTGSDRNRDRDTQMGRERERDGRGGEREGGEKEWWEERIIETVRGRKTKGSGDTGRKVEERQIQSKRARNTEREQTEGKAKTVFLSLSVNMTAGVIWERGTSINL